MVQGETACSNNTVYENVLNIRCNGMYEMLGVECIIGSIYLFTCIHIANQYIE